ncbi:MAG: hypothetical protein KA712_26140 [Myxococcales bacterium]|nr:hypothetical protein [Myxococcales bacterium]
MFFWGTQFFVALLGVGLSAIDLRIGIVIWFSLLVQAVSFFGMLVPSNQLHLPLLVFFPLSILVGLALEIGKSSLRWWLAGIVSAATLMLVRMSLEFEAWVAGSWSIDTSGLLLCNSLMVATALFLGFSSARGIGFLIRRGARPS